MGVADRRARAAEDIGLGDVTEDRVAVDEDRSTPIFSAYAGRVTKLFVDPGESSPPGRRCSRSRPPTWCRRGRTGTASTAFDKARCDLDLAQINDKRQRLLYDGKAVPLKEVRRTRATLESLKTSAVRRRRAGSVAQPVAHFRQDRPEITEFQTKGPINPAMPIYAPIGGTIVQRKVGPRQYVGRSRLPYRTGHRRA